MKKFLSLLRATTKGELNIFKMDFSKKKNTFMGKIKTSLIIIFLFIILLYSVGQYAFLMAEPLSKLNLTYIVLTLFMLVTSVVVFMEGIYKSQGVLFEAKDNDLLFSMPIKKSTIFWIRLFKLLFFQYIFEFIFLIPAIAIYAFFEIPSISFYFITLIMFILLPIIPTILACAVGYIIKALSNIFKNKKMIQIIFTLAFTLAIFFVSFRTQGFIENIVQNAQSINDAITRIYYPIGLYINCIQNFDVLQFLILIASNIIFAIVCVSLFSTIYFKIISKSSESRSNLKYSFKNKKFSRKSPLNALTSKELKRYFSSPIYIMNTMFGIILVFILAISASINLEGAISSIVSSGSEEVALPINEILQWFPKAYMAMLLFTIPTISITASSISMEGKSFNLTKSLPVNVKTIFLSKILTNLFIAIPPMLISTLVLIITRQFSTIDSLLCIAICVIVPIMMSIFGLLVNLKFPLLNAKSDVVVVKQSTSSFISIFGGFIICLAPILLYFILNLGISINMYALLCIIFFIILSAILWISLLKYGSKRFYEINI